MGRSLDKCKMRISRFARLNSGYFSLAITQPASPFVRHVRHEARLLVGRVATMSNTSCTLRTRKFMTNRLLARRQFVSAGIPEENISRRRALRPRFRDADVSGDVATSRVRRPSR
jgi:hypothetical protein